MRIISFIFLLLISLVFLRCEKNDTSLLSDYISYKSCGGKSFGTDSVRICFDSLVEDSRCPADVECFWQGVAVARFSVNINQAQYEATLSTINFSGGFSTDTILNGFKLRLLDLQPYPIFNSPSGVSGYKAKVEITRQ